MFCCFIFQLTKGGNAIFKHKGKRIKPNDTHLLYHTGLAVFGFTGLLVMLLFHLRSLMKIDWQTITGEEILSQFHIPLFLGSVLTAFFVCLLLGFLIYRYHIDRVKQLQHRQKLARMILENKWYESEQVQSDGFFKDLSSSKPKEKITVFPKMYYSLLPI